MSKQKQLITVFAKRVTKIRSFETGLCHVHKTTIFSEGQDEQKLKFHNFIIRRGIEVVITGLTRNQFVRKHTRVRIPPSAPRKSKASNGGLVFSFVYEGIRTGVRNE